jgi:hypothetical protein
MFNQKVNHFTSENPDYLNYSLGAPYTRAEDIHNCGTNIDKYRKIQSCGSLPLQSWCSPYVAVESFAMRPIVNSEQYFENIKKYLTSIIYTDSIALKNSKLSQEKYKLLYDTSREPDNSFLQMINLEATNKIMNIMGESANQIDMFKNYNPLCEGFVVLDIDINTYQSTTNSFHFYHKIIFSAHNTTRYNTVSFKAELYQDAQGLKDNWTTAIYEVQNSKDVTKGLADSNSQVYVSYIDLLNNTTCVTGQENDCEFKGYSPFFEKPVADVSWLSYPSLADNYYNNDGTYDSEGRIKIIDNGPPNMRELINSFNLKK